MADDRWDEQVGSVAQEAERLLESLRRAGAAATEGPEPDVPERSGDEPPGDESSGDEGWVCTDPFCRSCPLCRTVAVVRALSPETLRRLADLASLAAGVLSDLAGERGGPGDRPPPGSRSRAAPGERSAPGPGGASGPTARAIPVRDAEGGLAGG